MSNVVYATRADVKRSLGYGNVGIFDPFIDSALDSSSRSVEQLTQRVFYPYVDTKYFDWPMRSGSNSWTLYLDGAELVSLASATSGGVAVSIANLNLEPNQFGPPYTRVEVNLSTSTIWQSGPTFQRAISLTGTYGYDDNRALATTLASAVVSTSATTITVANSASLDVGSFLTVDSERLNVTATANVTTTATLGADIASASNVVTLSVSDGTKVNAGEVIQIDSELMYIVSITGNTLTVKRAFDGSQLALHTNGTTIYAPRVLTVDRGAAGSTAATHLISTSVYRQIFVSPIVQLTTAEAVNRLLQQTSGYSNQVGSGEGKRPQTGGSLDALRLSVQGTYGRSARTLAV